MILSLAINKVIEVEYITKKLEELNKSKRILKKYKKRIDYASLEELINISINNLEKSLEQPKYYLFDKIPSSIVSLFEEFLFADLIIEETELYKLIEELKLCPESLEETTKEINGLKERRSYNRFLNNINPFTVWRILTYVRNNNLDNEAVLNSLDKYYNLDRYITTGIYWNSGYYFLQIDEINNEDFLNTMPRNQLIGEVKTQYACSAIICYYPGNEYEKEDDYFEEWLDELDVKPSINKAKTNFMEKLSVSEMLSLEEKQNLYYNIHPSKSKLLKKEK